MQQGHPTLLAVFLCQILASILLVTLLFLYEYIKINRFPCGAAWLFIFLSLMVLDLLLLVPFLAIMGISLSALRGS